MIDLIASYVVPVVSIALTYVVGRLQATQSYKNAAYKEAYEGFYLPFISLLYQTQIWSVGFAYLMSTEQSPIWASGKNVYEILQMYSLKKGALNLSQIQQQNGDSNAMPCCFGQLGSDKTHAAFSFCEAKPTLHFHTLAFVFVILFFVHSFIFSGSAERRPRKTDAVLFAKVQIVAIAIVLVR